MIRCTPNNIFSWNFRISGEGHNAKSELDWFGEQGSITVDGVWFAIRKHGIFSGHWTLEHAEQEFASAQKLNAFTRTFEIHTASGKLVLRAASPFGRTFLIEGPDDVVATIAPEHIFTRCATIELQKGSLGFVTICFSFWLAVLTWRRTAQSNS